MRLCVTFPCESLRNSLYVYQAIRGKATHMILSIPWRPGLLQDPHRMAVVVHVVQFLMLDTVALPCLLFNLSFVVVQLIRPRLEEIKKKVQETVRICWSNYNSVMRKIIPACCLGFNLKLKILTFT